MSQNKTKARDQLLDAAKTLFARKGLSGTSIRDIANKAQLNSSLISYYFKSKDGLYTECLRQIGETRLSFVNDILQAPKNIEEFHLRTKMFIDNIFKIYLEDRETGLLIIREYDRVNSPAEKVFKSTFLQIFEQIEDFFKQAQKQKLIPKKRDPFIISHLFFGSLFSQMRLDHIRKHIYKRSLKSENERQKVTQHLIDIFCT